MRIAFLHIPKTAGQSIHHSLVELFPPNAVCPARTNEALYKLSVKQLSNYSLFSGHLDWSMLKLSGRFDLVFTVLRDPVDRILSFYFYLRKEAIRLSEAGQSIGEGMQAALNLSPKEYFTGASPKLRRFLDNHYNNFYAYYFASGSYAGYSLLSTKFQPGSSKLFDYALMGMNSLDKVYTISTLSLLERDLKILAGESLRPIIETNVNRSVKPSNRENLLTELSQGWDWKEELTRLSITDSRLYQRFDPRS